MQSFFTDQASICAGTACALSAICKSSGWALQEEGGEEAGEDEEGSDDEAGLEAEDPALMQLMSRPDGLQIMLRARKLVSLRKRKGLPLSCPGSTDLTSRAIVKMDLAIESFCRHNGMA